MFTRECHLVLPRNDRQKDPGEDTVPILATFYRKVCLSKGVAGHLQGYVPGDELTQSYE